MRNNQIIINLTRNKKSNMLRNKLCVIGISVVLLSTACSSLNKVTYLEAYAPEESSLNLVKITDEANNSVVAGTSFKANPYINYSLGVQGISSTNNFAWNTHNVLAISPDGTKLAYCTRMNGQDNIMVRSTGAQGMSTQRTFRNVHSFSWGADDKLYFSDINGNSNYICCINANAGSLMDQLTNGAVNDLNPVISYDGKKVFFTRITPTGPSIWSFNRENGTLTSCSRGYSPCLIKNNPTAYYCVRNSTEGRSEIWFVDYEKGLESLVVSDINRSFTNPQLSPDGKWLLLVGNSISNITKESNLDIFVVKTDGSKLTQLTFHPSTDTSPVWSSDGRSIFFISSRANKTNSFNVWRMNFNLE